MNWYLAAVKKYAEFSGRSRRKEYWMFTLFNFIFAVLALIIDNVAGTTVGAGGSGILYMVYVLAMFLPSLGLSVRRLHDVGKSGWFLFIILVPIVGGIWLLILVCRDGDAGDNKYGPNPKLVESAEPAV